MGMVRKEKSTKTSIRRNRFLWIYLLKRMNYAFNGYGHGPPEQDYHFHLLSQHHQ